MLLAILSNQFLVSAPKARLSVLRALLLANHIPVPLVDLALFEADLLAQLTNFLFAPRLTHYKFSFQKFLGVLIFAESLF